MNKEVLKKVIFDRHKLIKESMIFDREIKLEKDINYVLVGVRRAGKSTILYKRAKELVENGADWNQIIYINFDDDRLIDFKLENFDDILEVASSLTDKKPYFFFDEIQNVENWEKFARRAADLKLKVDITGSNAKMLSKEIEASLGGRYISKTVYPYSFKEYLIANCIDISDLSTSNVGKIDGLLDIYFNYGGFPETLIFLDKREYLSNLYQKIFLGDVLLRNSIRNVNGMRLMIRKIAETVGEPLSFTRLQHLISGIGYKISKDTLIEYADYINDSFLLFNIENYYASLLDKTSIKKYYFVDNGVLNLFLDDKKSALIENLVAINLYKKYKDELYYLKGQKVDIDFYLSNKKYAIRVAYPLEDQKAFNREINELLKFSKDKNNIDSKLIIVTYDEDKTLEIEGKIIEVISLKNFLLKDL